MSLLKLLFAGLTLIHGAIHMLGFVQGFEIARIEQLSQPVSQPRAIMWLAAAVLFAAAAAAFLLKRSWWWAVAIAAAAISQFLIVGSWQDARFGTTLNLLVLAVAVTGYGQWSFDRATDAAVQELLADASARAATVSFRDLDALPRPIARYFRFALREGQPAIRTARIKHSGKFKLDGKWIAFDSVQCFSVDPPAFVWDANMRVNPLTSVRVRDSYLGGKGSMLGKLFGLYPVVDSSNNTELDSGALQRYLAEAVWLPTALMPNEKLKWTPIDDHRAAATLTHNQTTVTLEFTVSESGEILEIFSRSRGREVDGAYVPTPWLVRVCNYDERNGMMVPIKGEVAWQTDAGNETYWKARVLMVDYK